MAKFLVGYYSRTGNTKKMAEMIAEGLTSAGTNVTIKSVDTIKTDELLDFDGIILGSPTYYGTMAAELKRLIDDSVTHHGKLDGKVGGAFSSSANIAGGNETTIASITEALLIHGMIIMGDAKGNHYGPVAIGKPDHRSEAECKRYGERIGGLAKRLFD